MQSIGHNYEDEISYGALLVFNGGDICSGPGAEHAAKRENHRGGWAYFEPKSPSPKVARQ